jgi:hypothetical protein
VALSVELRTRRTKAWGRSIRLGGVALVALLLASACTRTEERALREAISMGPWTFTVERATASTETRGGGRWRRIKVLLRLHNFREPHEPGFDAFLNGGGRGAYIVFPRFDLRDAQGTRFETLLLSASGSSTSEHWRAEFVLVPSDADSMADSARLAEPYLDKVPQDFRLVITNPDRRSGQPGRVSIALR